MLKDQSDPLDSHKSRVQSSGSIYSRYSLTMEIVLFLDLFLVLLVFNYCCLSSCYLCCLIVSFMMMLWRRIIIIIIIIMIIII